MGVLLARVCDVARVEVEPLLVARAPRRVELGGDGGRIHVVAPVEMVVVIKAVTKVEARVGRRRAHASGRRLVLAVSLTRLAVARVRRRAIRVAPLGAAIIIEAATRDPTAPRAVIDETVRALAVCPQFNLRGELLANPLGNPLLAQLVGNNRHVPEPREHLARVVRIARAELVVERWVPVRVETQSLAHHLALGGRNAVHRAPADGQQRIGQQPLVAADERQVAVQVARVVGAMLERLAAHRAEAHLAVVLHRRHQHGHPRRLALGRVRARLFGRLGHLAREPREAHDRIVLGSGQIDTCSDRIRANVRLEQRLVVGGLRVGWRPARALEGGATHRAVVRYRGAHDAGERRSRAKRRATGLAHHRQVVRQPDRPGLVGLHEHQLELATRKGARARLRHAIHSQADLRVELLRRVEEGDRVVVLHRQVRRAAHDRHPRERRPARRRVDRAGRGRADRRAGHGRRVRRVLAARVPLERDGERVVRDDAVPDSHVPRAERHEVDVRVEAVLDLVGLREHERHRRRDAALGRPHDEGDLEAVGVLHLGRALAEHHHRPPRIRWPRERARRVHLALGRDEALRVRRLCALAQHDGHVERARVELGIGLYERRGGR
mmetsp:Transcript_11433/g.36151  ORF Transcript_11433/g.36151 Transcript_11433/m.36151 type:complete len:611 (+) Transcript_11433:883-2715(+)